LLLHAAQALGVGTEKDLRDYFRLNPADSRPRLAELVEDGQLQTCEVRLATTAYCLPSRKSAQSRRQCLVVAVRFTDLGTQSHRAAVRFPLSAGDLYAAGQAVYGYYVLPFLHNERIAARVDLRAERASGAWRCTRCMRKNRDWMTRDAGAGVESAQMAIGWGWRRFS
jgi:uncharacterized protein YcaQ